MREIISKICGRQIVSALLICLVGCASPTPTQRIEITATAEEFCDDYERNFMDASRKYDSKHLKITDCLVTRITEDANNDYMLKITTNKSFMLVYIDENDILLKSVKIGSIVQVTGSTLGKQRCAFIARGKLFSVK